MGFTNMFKAMAWRLVRGWIGRTFLLVFAILIVVGVAALKVIGASMAVMATVSETSSDISLALSVLSSGEGGVDLVAASGALFVRGSFVAMLVAIFCGLFFAADRKHGAVKNVVQGRTGRRDYALAAGALTLCATALAVLVGLLVSAASLAAFGYALAAPDPGELLSWFVEVWLCVSAYALIAVAVALVTGSEAVSAIVGVMLGGAAVENLLYSAIGLITGHPDEVRAVFDGYLAVALSRLGGGAVLPWEALVPALATVGVAVLIGVAVVRRRSLA